MNLELRALYREMEGRYPTAAEAVRLEQYAADLLERTSSAEAVARAEAVILDEVASVVLARFPDMARAHGPGTDARVRRDQAMVLRYAVMAMVMSDPNFIYDKLAVWLRTILLALCDPQQVILGLRQLLASSKKHLTAADAAHLAPYIETVIDEFVQNTKEAA